MARCPSFLHFFFCFQDFYTCLEQEAKQTNTAHQDCALHNPKESDVLKIETRLKEHFKLVVSPDRRLKMKDVICECTSVYLRSRVPEDERPQLNHKVAFTDEKVFPPF